MRREYNARWEQMKRCEAADYENRRRVETLQKAVELGVRISEEERRLAVIRTRKLKVEGDTWTVVVYPEVQLR